MIPSIQRGPPAICLPAPACRQIPLRSLFPITLLATSLLAQHPAQQSPPFQPATPGTNNTNAQPQQPDALAQARSLIRANDFAAAEPILRAYLASTPDSAPALYLLAFALHRENKPKDSLATYTRAAAVRPPGADDLRIVALDYVLLNDYPDAIRWLRRSLAANPRNPDAWYALGRAQMNQGDFVEAERAFNKTLALTPADSKTLDNLGLSLEAQNRTDEALAAYRRAIAAQPTSSGAPPHGSEQPFLNLGTLLNSKARSAEAIGPLQQSVLLAPGCPRCHEELSRAYLSTGQDAPATREMEQAVQLDPKNPRFHFQLGKIYRRAGLLAQADAELKISASLYGSHSTPEDK